MSAPIWILQPDADGNCCDCAGRVEPCDSCSPVTGCACALHIPQAFGQVPYASYVDAASVVYDPLQVASCIGALNVTSSAGTPSYVTNTFSITPDTNTVDCHWNLTNSLPGGPSLVSVWFAVGATTSALNVSLNRVTNQQDCDGATMRLYTENLTLVDSVTIPTLPPCSNSAGGSASITPPSDSCYYIQIEAVVFRQNGGINTTTDVTFTLSSSLVVFNPVVALWDDSGTTRQLKACPKMLLPLFTENTHNWYASQAAAQSVLSDPSSVSNCIGYNDPSTAGTLTSFVANGTTSLSLDIHKTNIFLDGSNGLFICAGNVNLVKGATVSINWSYSWTNDSPTQIPNMLISTEIFSSEGYLDSSGTSFSLLPGSSSNSGSISFPSTIPANGNYTITIGLQRDIYFGGSLNISVSQFNNTIVSTSTLSVNPIQALYNVSLDCPARLDCS